MQRRCASLVDTSAFKQTALQRYRLFVTTDLNAHKEHDSLYQQDLHIVKETELQDSSEMKDSEQAHFGCAFKPSAKEGPGHRNCRRCLAIVEDEFHLVFDCQAIQVSKVEYSDFSLLHVCAS